MKSFTLSLQYKLRRFGLFRASLFASVGLHVFCYLIYFILTLPSNAAFQETSIEDMDVSFEEIPPELLGGTSSPAPVEKQEWVEGSNKEAEEKPDNSDLNPNQLSGNGTDKDGYLFSFNGDRPPTPIIDFDLKAYFPEAAKAANISQRTVIVMVQVDEHGVLQGVKVVSGRAGYGFDEAAIRIIQRARFSPGYDKGKPTRMAHRLPISFDLEED
ncbi:energy transducer TonB [Leptospira kanakyensis]|uniref:Energy transducer TonB n=1 Tax=Leptospira kanakyensis TaxID=2484968 RepID=A0A6N4QDG3_9LEPT|nr:energy transducer TonB [Leptospira kanakyensis]TGK54482.1 energy transducer TonB [Leptospira kanakyensis]TGK59050.1 energy transducer TonB [Leptospira kanakyensis]TGK75201.1 energy transducer TonB [Leptospira kanakyensis]